MEQHVVLFEQCFDKEYESSAWLFRKSCLWRLFSPLPLGSADCCLGCSHGRSSQKSKQVLSECFTSMLVRDAGFEPGTAASGAWR